MIVQDDCRNKKTCCVMLIPIALISWFVTQRHSHLSTAECGVSFEFHHFNAISFLHNPCRNRGVLEEFVEDAPLVVLRLVIRGNAHDWQPHCGGGRSSSMGLGGQGRFPPFSELLTLSIGWAIAGACTVRFAFFFLVPYLNPPLTPYTYTKNSATR